MIGNKKKENWQWILNRIFW